MNLLNQFLLERWILFCLVMVGYFVLSQQYASSHLFLSIMLLQLLFFN
jgi:hypothetical protein